MSVWHLSVSLIQSELVSLSDTTVISPAGDAVSLRPILMCCCIFMCCLCLNAANKLRSGNETGSFFQKRLPALILILLCLVKEMHE